MIDYDPYDNGYTFMGDEIDCDPETIEVPIDTLQRIAAVARAYTLLYNVAVRYQYTPRQRLVTKLNDAVKALTPEDLSLLEQVMKGGE